jgi:hypothetical protein
MAYKIIDNQGMGTHEEDVFETKEEVRQHLIDFHRIDYTGEEPIDDMSLSDILNYGDWDIEEIKSN